MCVVCVCVCVCVCVHCRGRYVHKYACWGSPRLFVAHVCRSVVATLGCMCLLGSFGFLGLVVLSWLTAGCACVQMWCTVCAVCAVCCVLCVRVYVVCCMTGRCLEHAWLRSGHRGGKIFLKSGGDFAIWCVWVCCRGAWCVWSPLSPCPCVAVLCASETLSTCVCVWWCRSLSLSRSVSVCAHGHLLKSGGILKSGGGLTQYDISCVCLACVAPSVCLSVSLSVAASLDTSIVLSVCLCVHTILSLCCTVWARFWKAGENRPSVCAMVCGVSPSLSLSSSGSLLCVRDVRARVCVCVCVYTVLSLPCRYVGQMWRKSLQIWRIVQMWRKSLQIWRMTKSEEKLQMWRIDKSEELCKCEES